MRQESGVGKRRRDSYSTPRVKLWGHYRRQSTDVSVRKTHKCEKGLLHEGPTCTELWMHKPRRRAPVGALGSRAGGGEGTHPPFQAARVHRERSLCSEQLFKRNCLKAKQDRKDFENSFNHHLRWRERKASAEVTISGTAGSGG